MEKKRTKSNPGFNDLQLAAKVRNLALNQIYDLLSDNSEGNKTVKMELLKRLAPNLLPRLNEHSGPDGQPIPILNGIHSNNSNPQDTATQKEN